MDEEGGGVAGERGRKRGRDPIEEEAVGVEGGEEGGVLGEMGDRGGRVVEGGSGTGVGGGRRFPRPKRRQARSQRESGRVRGAAV